jgi:hypothetical protein
LYFRDEAKDGGKLPAETLRAAVRPRLLFGGFEIAVSNELRIEKERTS